MKQFYKQYLTWLQGELLGYEECCLAVSSNFQLLQVHDNTKMHNILIIYVILVLGSYLAFITFVR